MRLGKMYHPPLVHLQLKSCYRGFMYRGSYELFSFGSYRTYYEHLLRNGFVYTPSIVYFEFVEGDTFNVYFGSRERFIHDSNIHLSYSTHIFRHSTFTKRGTIPSWKYMIHIQS